MKHALFVSTVTAFLGFTALTSPSAHADAIGLTVAPTRLVIADGQRFGGTILVANRSDQPMRFRVQFRPSSATEPDPATWLKAAPRSMLLAPGEAQTIRMITQVPAGFTGERRAYVAFIPMPAEEVADPQLASASLSVLTAPVIPVILRVGVAGEPQILVDQQVKAGPDGLLTATVRRPDGQPAVSSHGDLAVCDAAGLLGRVTATTLWPEVQAREYTVKPTREIAGPTWATWIPRKDSPTTTRACQRPAAQPAR
ncbi:hypothetical protein CHU95_00410 [Niveispirillum lacus]|uniref:Pili assembly chaperone N-terminal domain-containing protein n=1 Tax=Niveispirillum lacus TaxID=1981099 RepID=A0A255Z8L1_9PROT|nr:hypothetical protein [Niveispirillum lacus]OYQ37808.1 hypothetical protein CHU95_00410 [Niveispirillum lacus]